MGRTPKIRQEIGLYGIAIRAAEKANADLSKTYKMIQDSDIGNGSTRWVATEDLARAIDALRVVKINLEARIRQAEDLDRQIIEEDPYAHLGTATAAALRSMTPLERSRLTGR